MIKIHSISIF